AGGSNPGAGQTVTPALPGYFFPRASFSRRSCWPQKPRARSMRRVLSGSSEAVRGSCLLLRLNMRQITPTDLVSGRHLLEQVAATFGGVVVARRAAAPIFFACRPGV